MKITKIDAHLVNMGSRNVPFVKVHTDEGIYGVGEAYSVGPDKATVEVIKDFEGWLIGRDPRDIEALWHLMYAGSRFPGGAITNAAISGIEHALWDILGKSVGLPVYRLLGGKCRDKIRVYQGVGGRTAEETAENAARLVEKYGYTALKLGSGIFPPDWATLPWLTVLRDVEARVAAVREAVGDAVDIGIDPHARMFEPARAAEFCDVVAPFKPLFVEEPLRPENYDAMVKLRSLVRVTLASGEMLYTRHEFRELLALQAVDIIQPDICLTGGLWEMKKIASMAEAHYVSVAPHNPCGPIANAVNVHFAASTQNFLVLEYNPDDNGVRSQIIDEPMKLVDGYLEIPEKPGLGIDLIEDEMVKHPYKPWRRGQPWRVDGSLADQ